MDREYLEDYEKSEKEKSERFLKKFQEGKFCFERDRYPSDARFFKLKRPVAFPTSRAAGWGNFWGQIPFCGSLIISLPPYSPSDFEKFFFEISEIPKIIDFIKETGKLQVVLNHKPIQYVKCDYLEPFFTELRPPFFGKISNSYFWASAELEKTGEAFATLARIKFYDYLSLELEEETRQLVLDYMLDTYMFLKLSKYMVVDDIENLMVDDPPKVLGLMNTCTRFIVNPVTDTRGDITNFTLAEAKEAGTTLPIIYQPHEKQFPCEIGAFLLRKLTYTPKGLRACYNLIDHYKDYDLQKVQQSLNEAIVTNHPDTVNESTEELSEILDNVWNDKTIPKRIENIKIGVPISIAAIGAVAGGLTGGLAGVGTGGFLAELGFKVAEKAVEKFFSVKGEGLSERIAKLRTKSYQANVYDFKKKYDLK